MSTNIRKNNHISPPEQFFVIGIGASAGGLEAFKLLIKEIPADSGMAYILVQHLDPTHESILVELLQKVTIIPIEQATDKVVIRPDHIYVIPFNQLLTTTDGILKLTPRNPSHKGMTIDIFFNSLAEVHQTDAVGVVLSGTGKDGTLGLRSIKDNGGITFAQSPESAAFDEMPLAAISAKVADFIHTPAGIVHQLLELKTILSQPVVAATAPIPAADEMIYKEVMGLIDLRKGVDFGYYKQTTIRRRIARRVAVRGLARIEDYLAFLKTNPSEVDLLFQDILIPVTEFFRDPKAFETLIETALPALTINKKENDSFRVWCVGCSTGQETYSLAMTLFDFFEKTVGKIKIQLFATDISETAIAQARSGFYSRAEVSTISEDRLEKFFLRTEGGFQIKKSIRDLCVFAMHNVLANPPFAGIDLVSCRNVLIYMDSFLQRKVMATFHYALNDKGMLFLGKSESVGNSSDLFAPFNEAEKLYSRKLVPGRFVHVLSSRRLDLNSNGNVKAVQVDRPNDDYQRNADDIVIAKSPAGVIVNDSMEIVQFRGTTGDWLESAPGKPSLNVLKMAKHGLALELRNALHKAKVTRQPVLRERLPLQMKGWKKIVTIEVIPLLNTINPYYLILFRNTEETLQLIPETMLPGKQRKSVQEVRTLQLEQELKQTREDMRIISEDQEAGNEELLSANEELLSGSEELRSLNEELEISKEELQSTVEELSVANQELGFRNEQLNNSGKYSDAIISTIKEPLIVLDKEYKIKSANAAFYKIFRTNEREMERQIFFDAGKKQWDVPALRKMFNGIMNNEVDFDSYEMVRREGGEDRILMVNARKIVWEGTSGNLLLLVIEDITDRRTIENNLKTNADNLRMVLESSPQISIGASALGAVTYFNQHFLQYTGLSLNELLVWGWLGVIHADQKEAASHAWMKSVSSGEPFYMELRFKRWDGEYRWHILRTIAIRNDEGHVTSWVGTAADIHDQKMFAAELEKEVRKRTQSLKESNIELEHANKNLEQFAFIASHDLQEPLRKIKTFSNLLSENFSAPLPPDGRRLVNMIHKSSDRMSALIHDVLNFSRIQSSEHAFVETDLNTILNNVIEDFSLLVQEKNATFKRDILPILYVIPLQINQLFYNLISNALKFTREGVAPRISISSRRLPNIELAKYPNLTKNALYCEIQIMDNGLGFEEKYKDKLFMIFQKLHVQQQFSGTGIGLALCKKIVNNHHGEIFAESTANEGAKFSIILPLNSQVVYPDLLPGYVD